ncbi:MAG: ribonuclease R [Gemmatimonadetes bacterium]|nr:ribonuclease R [Gemmatimonadota bacterium]
MRVSPSSIVEWLEASAERPATLREIAEGLELKRSDRRALRTALRELVEAGSVYPVRGNRYAVPDRLKLVVGRFRGSRGGGGIVVPESGGPELYVRTGDTASAVDGDRVVARPEGHGRRGRSECRIIRVLERARSRVVGRFHLTSARSARGGRAVHGRAGAAPPAAGWVVPEDPRIARHVVIPDASRADAQPGDVVVARIVDWGDSHRGPTGSIERVLGPSNAPGVDVLAIVHAHELPSEFGAEAVEHAERLRARGITAEDLDGREDFRETLVFTIDPVDAKDHDDALSITVNADGASEVGVHIADVSHYVTPGDAVDAEARERATSVYLVDRAIPMLPVPISSDLCSLLPDRDRLTLTVLLGLDENGEVRSTRITPSIIRSRHRLSYDDAQEVLAGQRSVEPALDDALRRLASFAEAQRRKRIARGSLDFDLPEARVLLDASGRPIAVEAEARHESHRLVEDLMLLANETIGRAAKRNGVPFIYRVHEPPDEIRLAELADVARALGFEPPRGRPSPHWLQAALREARDKPGGSLFTTLALRSMKPARYSENDVGHFGLATSGYTHFTSPIRRYPDLVVHRIVRSGLARGQGPRESSVELAAIARHSSDRERIAQSAERDSVSLKKVRFMEQHLGAVFDGTISEVRPFGFFVLLEDHFVEGLVHVSAIGDDYYRWDEERFLLVGERTRRRFTIGQVVGVQVSAVDVEARRIDFILAAPPARGSGRPAQGRRKRKSD